MQARGSVEIMAEVVFARPDHLHRHTGRLRQIRRLDRVVGGEASAEAAADARHVHGDVLARQAEHASAIT